MLGIIIFQAFKGIKNSNSLTLFIKYTYTNILLFTKQRNYNLNGLCFRIKIQTHMSIYTQPCKALPLSLKVFGEILDKL